MFVNAISQWCRNIKYLLSWFRVKRLCKQTIRILRLFCTMTRQPQQPQQPQQIAGTAATTTDANSLTAFNTTGFTLGSGNTAGNQVNTSAATYVVIRFLPEAIDS